MRCVFEDYSQRKFIFCLIVLLLSPAFGREKFNISHEGRSFKKFSLKETCQKKYGEKPLLVEVENKISLNCMGKVFVPNELCLGESRGKSRFTRSLISTDQQSVLCEFATMVKVNLDCDHDILKKSCDKSSYIACKSLSNYYAKNLNIIHHAVLSDQGEKAPKLLDCHFSSIEF